MKTNFCIILVLCFFACRTKEESTTTPQALAFGPTRYGELCRKGLDDLSKNNMEGFNSVFAEDVIYRFNNGDSIVGKKAVADYWVDRRTNVIEKIEFSSAIWLPLQVNDTTQGVRPGLWVLGWYKSDITYKTGKSVNQFLHTLYHFDENDKVDEVIQYLDRLPIMQATTK